MSETPLRKLRAYHRAGLIRTNKLYETGWYWTPFTYRFDHGGWLYFNPREPRQTARWLWRWWRGAPGDNWREPSMARHGAIRYTVRAARDSYFRAKLQIRKAYRLWRLGNSVPKSVARTAPDAWLWVRLEAMMFARRIWRGRFW